MSSSRLSATPAAVHELLEAYDAVFARWATMPSVSLATPVPALPHAFQHAPFTAFTPLSLPLSGVWHRAYTRLVHRLQTGQPLPSPQALQVWTCAMTTHEWVRFPDETFCVWCEVDAKLYAIHPACDRIVAIQATETGWRTAWQIGDALQIREQSAPGTSLRRVLLGLLQVLQTTDVTTPLTIVVPTQAIFKAVTQNWVTRWQQAGWQTQDGQPVKHADLWAQLPPLPGTIHWHWEPATAPLWSSLPASSSTPAALSPAG